jgi:hypothetical protein
MPVDTDWHFLSRWGGASGHAGVYLFKVEAKRAMLQLSMGH